MALMEIESPVTGVVWRVATVPGDRVSAGDTVIVVESMKMEIPVIAERAGTVTAVKVATGDVVQEGDVLLALTV